MIRNSIDYSEYEIYRSNFEFWDRLDDKELWNEPPSVLRDEKLQYVTITLDWRNSKLIFDFPSSTRNTNGKYDHIVEELTANDTDYDEYLKFYLSLYDIIHR